MIPNNSFTSTPVMGEFLYLADADYTPLTQTVMGGVALNDASLGRLYQSWTVTYDGTDILISTPTNGTVFTLTTPDVTSVSLAFDTNISIVLTWTTSAGANLYYYNTLTSMYVTRYFPDVSSCRVCVDDPRDFNFGSSDVIFGYTLNGNLCYRQQRDRYDTEYVIASSSKLLTRMGPTTANRVQFETV